MNTMTSCKSVPKRSEKSRSYLYVGVMTSVTLFGASLTFAGPENGVVVAGSGTVSMPASNATVINQNSQNMAINWSSFNVGENESVQFIQPNSSSMAFNRIFDQSASSILGSISANGRVVLMNGKGIIFGPNAKINTGSLVASTMDISNGDFMEGRLRFEGAEGNDGVILNQGLINASSGSVALLGNSVENTGMIVASAGTVTLAAGKSATLDFDGDGLLSVAVDKSVIENAAGVADGVLNSGEINAGAVLLTTHAARDVFTHAVNNEGVIHAAQIDTSGGTIRLVGTMGETINSGKLDASGSQGGRIEVLGEKVTIASSSKLDASGDNRGGTILVGGDYQGKGAEVIAQTTTVEKGATLDADARNHGNGGKVIVWADDSTHFNGSISSRGGALDGDGGFAEVSGKILLDFGDDGLVDLSAINGSEGTLLLDPANIRIVGVQSQSDLNGDGTTGDFITGDIFAGDFGGVTSVIATSKLNLLLRSANVYLEATNSITLGGKLVTLLNYGSDVAGSTGAYTLTMRAPNISLHGHVHGNGMLNVIASNRLYLGVNLHFTELKPVYLSGVSGNKSTLSGGKNYVITGKDMGTVNLVNGTLEDAGNSTANVAKWSNFAFIEGLADADVAQLAADCPSCVAGSISGANNFTFLKGGKLSGGIIGVDINDTIVDFNAKTTFTLQPIEIEDATLADESVQLFSTVDDGLSLPCDQSEEEGCSGEVEAVSWLGNLDPDSIASAYVTGL